MPNEVEVVELTEILFVIQGQRDPRTQRVHPATTVAEFATIVARAGGIDDAVEVLLEDGDEPLGSGLLLIEHLSVAFAPLHVARQRVKIVVTVEYNLKDIGREFRSNATIERIIRWAIGPDGFALEGDASDYQMKYDGEVVPPDTHLGQLPHPHHKVKLDLVFKIKPQGDRGVV